MGGRDGTTSRTEGHPGIHGKQTDYEVAHYWQDAANIDPRHFVAGFAPWRFKRDAGTLARAVSLKAVTLGLPQGVASGRVADLLDGKGRCVAGAPAAAFVAR